MRRAERHDLSEFSLPSRQALPWAGIDEIDGMIVEMRLGAVYGGASIGAGMIAAKEFERFIIERLDTNRQAVDASECPRRWVAGDDVIRIRFQCDFSVRRQPKRIVRGLQNCTHLARGE